MTQIRRLQDVVNPMSFSRRRDDVLFFPFSKSSRYFRNACKKLLEKNLISISIRAGVFFKKVFLNFVQNSWEITCVAYLFFNQPAILLKNRLWHSYFLMNFPKYLRILLLQNISRRLLLSIAICQEPLKINVRRTRVTTF